MELREWLIILGLALVSLIVIDGVRRLQRQRRVPRLDQADKDLPDSQFEDPEEAAKAAEINWELPNGGARVVKPADYSGLGNKPKLERQEHPGPSRVLAEFRRSASAKSAKRKADKAEKADAVARRSQSHTTTSQPWVDSEPAATREAPNDPVASADHQQSPVSEHERREPSISFSSPQTEQPLPTETAPETTPETNAPTTPVTPDAAEAPKQPPHEQQEQEPVLRAEPEDAVYAKHAASDHGAKRRQLRPDTVGDHDELDDDEVDEYRLVDFEGMGRSLKRRLIARRKEKQRKKAEKAIRDEALAKQKAERKALEAEQRREAKEAADAERARLAQEQAVAREAAASAAAAERLAAEQRSAEYAESGDSADVDASDEYLREHAADSLETDERGEESIRVHPTLEKALRHDVNGEHAKETLTNAEEVVVISVLSRDPEGFDGAKLLDLMMVCGLRYSRAMGVFHRFETESDDSELQFSMVNVVKPGTFPIEEMDEFTTPGVTLLMPLPGAVDSSVAFEAMVETAMVVVRHMGGELKDENHSVMTAQTIEFARQRVREFERRHRLHRQLQAR